MNKLLYSFQSLDLGRVGIIPSPRFLPEEASKIIDEAFDWSIGKQP